MAIAVIAGLVILEPHVQPQAYSDIGDAVISPGQIRARNLETGLAAFVLPVWVRDPPRSPAPEHITVASGAVRISDVQLDFARYRFRAEVADDSALVAINTFYFPGWSAYIDGREHAIVRNNPRGVIQLRLDRGSHQVDVRFEDTPVRQWAGRISFLGLVPLLLSAA